MKKRQFLSASLSASIGAGLGAIATSASPVQAADKRGSAGPALLTVTGAIERSNRRAFDATRDVMMAKQKLSFEKAYTFDFAQLHQLPKVSIKPQLEYDAKPHLLQGPLLSNVLQVCGLAGNTPETVRKIILRAVDGYAASYTLEQIRKLGFILATHMDEQPMALGGLGPLWSVFDVESQPEYASKPLAVRFAGCPWAVYHIDVA